MNGGRAIVKLLLDVGACKQAKNKVHFLLSLV